MTADVGYVEVVGEEIGIIGRFYTSGDIAPPNPAEPGSVYFRIPFEGWGLGLTVGSVLRFNTSGTPSWWTLRITQPGALPTSDGVGLEHRGDY